MAVIDTNVDALVRRLGASMEDELRQAIEDQIRSCVDNIIKESARQIARSLHTRVLSYDDHLQNKLKVVLILNGEESDVLPTPTRELL